MSATIIERLAIDLRVEEANEPSFVAFAALALPAGTETEATLDVARSVLLGALADLFLALNQAEGMRWVRALLPGNIRPGGARVPGTSYELEPCVAASAIGALISATAKPMQSALRTCSLGALLAVADFEDRKRAWRGISPLTVRQLLDGLIRAERVRRALEQSSALAMREQHCLLGATSVVALTLLPGTAVQVGEALQRVWQSADESVVPLADLHAEAVRRALGTHDPSSTGVTPTPLPVTVLRSLPIAVSVEPERSVVTQRFEAAMQTRLPLKQCERIKAIVAAPEVLDGMAVNAFVAELVANQA